MTNKGKTPSLLTGSSGKPVIATTQRVRQCVRCKLGIAKGATCFEIPKVGKGFSSTKTFCIVCFRLILNQTKKDFELIENQLKELEASKDHAVRSTESLKP